MGKMAAAKGNEYAKKFETPKKRKAVCKALCAHLENGRTMDCFPPLAKSNIYRYMKDHPEDFPEEVIEEARRKGNDELLGKGEDGMMGRIPGFNATVWIFMMKNKCNWKDRQDAEIEQITPPIININLPKPD